MTPREVAARYGVSVETVATWIRSGQLIAVNVSRSRHSRKPRWRISDEALESFELSRRPNQPQSNKRPRNQWVRSGDKKYV